MEETDIGSLAAIFRFLNGVHMKAELTSPVGGAAEAQSLLCQEAVGRWSDWPGVLGQECWPRESLGGSIGQCGRSYF